MTKRLVYVTILIIGVILLFSSVYFYFSIESSNFYTLASYSMVPALFPGDTVKLDNQISVDEIHASLKDSIPPGDIIAFNEPGASNAIILHRAVSKIDNGDGTYSFKTWGDNNSFQDWWEVHEQLIIGKVVEVNPPFWTYNILFWLTILGIGLLLTIFGSVLFVFNGWHFKFSRFYPKKVDKRMKFQNLVNNFSFL